MPFAPRNFFMFRTIRDRRRTYGITRYECTSFILRTVIVILLVIIIWQLWLVVITIYDLMLGITDDRLFQPMNLSRPKIPPIIHQMWKTSNLSSYPINTSHTKWKTIFPDYTIRLWTDTDLNQLFLLKEYSYLPETYLSYPFNIQRADLARLVVLHYQGGIYADLDVFPRNRSIEQLRSSGASFIVPRSSSDSSLTNYFLVSEPRSKIIDDILRHVPSNAFYRRILFIPYLQVFSTGSIFLTRLCRQWTHPLLYPDNLLWVLSSKQMTSYVGHDAGRSWHLLDGYFFNMINELPQIIIYMLVFILILSCLFFLLFFVSCLMYHKNISMIIRLLKNP